jgi:hypothetical protein
MGLGSRSVFACGGVIIAAASASCAAFSSADESPADPPLDPGAEAGGEDAGAKDGEPGDGVAGAGNLIVNGGFEQAGAACGPGWSPRRSTLTRSTEARSGEASCLVCLDPGMELGNVWPSDNKLADAKAGDTYFAEAWVAAAPEGPAAKMIMHLLVDDTDVAFTSVIPGQSWERVQIQGAADHDGVINFALRVSQHEALPACFLVDDVVVVKQ